MPAQGWTQLLNSGAPWQTTVGPVLSAISATPGTTISPQAATTKNFAVSTAYLYPGAVFLLTANGYMTTTATSTNFTVFPVAGATPTILATPVAITTGTTVITGIQWSLRCLCRVTAIASTGNTISSQGEFTLFNNGAGLPANPMTLTGTVPGMLFPMPNASGETAAAIDTTTAMPLMINAISTVAGPSVTCTQFIIEHCN